ncbi:hypothetical protein V5P93_002009 [Actinokineospora auranticolor]|uniref:Uncharacterized protein n=1 Tax=Actinokineospora auranticolor TaxID=155976 RepID=A0A2S6GEJ5_9PSEU|nr:hypothetical protein [Actinokineospora auranticolor]PPK63653.1 hypothetical protein CLV40_12660 [Actinokineospora auranticolor]
MFSAFKREFAATSLFTAVVAAVSSLGGIYGQVFAIGPWGLVLALGTILVLTTASAVRRGMRSNQITKTQVAFTAALLVATVLILPIAAIALFT